MKKNISELPPVNEVDEQEKNLILAEANRIGVRAAAEKHGLTWQRVASWKRTTKESPLSKKLSKIIIQSPLGGEISTEEILAKVGEAEKIYIRVDENKAYWVKGQQNGSIDLW